MKIPNNQFKKLKEIYRYLVKRKSNFFNEKAHKGSFDDGILYGDLWDLCETLRLISKRIFEKDVEN